ncbi:MAG TPA: hypothetical protein VEK15_28555 [Vicinamibacteria bacterium]|nr:hypothetical protein [Vicinamibacteria bacterium]
MRTHVLDRLLEARRAYPLEQIPLPAFATAGYRFDVATLERRPSARVAP